MTADPIGERLDRIEGQLEALRRELAEVRRQVESPPARTPELLPAAPPPPPAPTLDAAWQALEHGRIVQAVEQAFDVLDRVETEGDESTLLEVAAFAAAAERVAPASLRDVVRELGERVGLFDEPEPAPAETGPSLAERTAAFVRTELTGPRAFALAGGVVTLLGIVFLFVLAANRGWIGPVTRVSIGATASLAVLLAGVALRARFGRTQASLAAVGTGIAGGYATLAAATILYGFLPSGSGLLVAAAIAGTGSLLAHRWSSEVLGGLSLVGAAAAPGLVALDDGIGAPGTAFAVIVLAAALAGGAPRRWSGLVLAVAVPALGQVLWLTAEASARDAGTIAVVSVASLVLLGGALAWQRSSRADGLDPFAASLCLGGGALALGALPALLPGERDPGVALLLAAAAYAGAGLLAARRRSDLGWVAGFVALLLVGIATSYLLSERSLTVAWAIEATALAGLAGRLAAPRFQVPSFVYLALAAGHALAVDLRADGPAGDLPSSAAPGLFALAAAALAVASLVPGRRGDGPAVGLLAAFEPLWNGVVSGRGSIRFLLWSGAVAFGAAGTAALLSGRWVTIAWAGLAAALGAGARALGERRLQGTGVSFLGLALLHALAVEAPLGGLALTRGLDPLAPVPSLAALAAAAGALAALAAFPERGIVFLGPLEGAERSLEALGSRHLRNGLLVSAAWLAAWAAGLLLVEGSYEPGQAGATALWAAHGATAVALAARRRSGWLLLAGAVPALLAFGKATLFDWDELGDGPAAAALLAGAVALLLLGFLARYAAAESIRPLEAVALVTAGVASGSALVAVDRLAPDRIRLLGAAALVVAVAVAAFAVPPYHSWRSRRPEPWLRDHATVHWSVALATLGFAELALADGARAPTLGAWALSAAAVAAAARPLGEGRLWLAGAAGGLVASASCLALVTPPTRLFVASAHPGEDLWALAACTASLAWVAHSAPTGLRPSRALLALPPGALALGALSLGVVELVAQVSGASVETDFQRGHTAMSALWGVLALALFAAGLVRAAPVLQRGGLVLFGLALAKLFLYDLRTLSSVTRAFSFLAVGAILLAAAFLVERIVRRSPSTDVGIPDRAPS